MKRNEITDLRTKSAKDLQTTLQETRVALARTKLELKMGKQSNFHVARDLRKKTAILHTLIREQELGAKA